jgi:hypothetical protein
MCYTELYSTGQIQGPRLHLAYLNDGAVTTPGSQSFPPVAYICHRQTFCRLIET